MSLGSIQSEHSPCYLNRMDVSEIAVGWGRYTLELLRTFVSRYSFLSSGYHPLELFNCMSPPARSHSFMTGCLFLTGCLWLMFREYQFPKDLYHFD